LKLFPPNPNHQELPIEANHRLLPDGQLIQSWQPKKAKLENSRHLAKRLRAWDWIFQYVFVVVWGVEDFVWEEFS